MKFCLFVLRYLDILWPIRILTTTAWGARGDVKYLGSLLSCPLLRLLLGDIGFVYPVMSMVVTGPSLPILRQRRWSLLYDVY
jgi:hypothetical protein